MLVIHTPNGNTVLFRGDIDAISFQKYEGLVGYTPKGKKVKGQIVSGIKPQAE